MHRLREVSPSDPGLCTAKPRQRWTKAGVRARGPVLTKFLLYSMFSPSRSPRASPETSRRRSGMRRPARAARNRAPGGARQNRPSATTSGTRECANARPRAPLMCNARRFRQGGSGANNRRGGAPRGERRRCDARRPATARLRASSSRYAPAGLRHWPADGCRCTRAPVGAPLPSFVQRETFKPRRRMCLARRETCVQICAAQA